MQNEMKPVFFFDSWGRLHVSCSQEEVGAAPFGPTGSSRPADPAEAGLVVADMTPWRAASLAGRLSPRDEALEYSWDVLMPAEYCEWIRGRAQAIHEMGHPWTDRHLQKMWFDVCIGKRDEKIVSDVVVAVRRLQGA